MNHYTQKKVEAAVDSMNALVQGLVSKFSPKEKLKFGTLNEPIRFDEAPQNLHRLEYKNRVIFVQMLKPKLAACFYFVKDGVHIFTDSIEEVYEFLTKEIDLSPVRQVG